MRYIAGDFGLQSAGKAKDELIHTLNEFLLRRYQQGLDDVAGGGRGAPPVGRSAGGNPVLTNLETSQQKLLQIVLAGQPELDQKLDSHELRQLKQRVALRCHLDCSTWRRPGDYMRRRLTIAGDKRRRADF